MLPGCYLSSGESEQPRTKARVHPVFSVLFPGLIKLVCLCNNKILYSTNLYVNMGFHYLRFRTYSHATENEKNVEKALRFVSGTDKIEKRKTKGYHGNPIIIIEAEIKKSMEVKAFFSGLKKHGLVEKILDELEDRIDENSNFYLRFDKQKAFFQKYELVKHDDVVSVKGKIKCFPPDKENAIKVLKIFLENL